jgi:hypothetical protein
MTFLYAAYLARTHGYSSCLFLPNDHLLFTPVESTLALFASCEEVGQVQCVSYHDLVAMNEEGVLTTLQKTASPTSTDEPKKRRRVSKDAHS